VARKTTSQSTRNFPNPSLDFALEALARFGFKHEAHISIYHCGSGLMRVHAKFGVMGADSLSLPW
jgi:hypothetical protein